jgi:periplasmic divalent cation tolerance protein
LSDATTHHCQVSVTAGSADEAGELGRTAVEAGLAACAQVSGPIASTYRWKGEIESAVEWVCVLKTTTANVTPLIASLRMAHRYDTPEIIVVPIENGDPDYLAWITDETRPRDATPGRDPGTRPRDATPGRDPGSDPGTPTRDTTRE